MCWSCTAASIAIIVKSVTNAIQPNTFSQPQAFPAAAAQLNSNTIDESIDAIAYADMLIIAGTSLTVYPAASLVHYFHGKHLVLINRDPTPMDERTSLTLHGKVGEILSQIIVRR